MKLLSIGNSFSQDAQKWLHSICEDIHAVNLYIGGCPLVRHWNNYISEEPAYEMWVNGVLDRNISINEALTLEDWDVITFQQASPGSGDYTTFQPYLNYLYREVKRICPNAKYYIHQTWSYEVDCKLPAFDHYMRSRYIMDKASIDAYNQASQETGLPLIPCGDLIRYIRSMPEFDYPRGGKSINRDGFHLSFDYGRYAAGLMWYAFLTGGDPRKVDFVPVVNDVPADKALLEKLGQAVYAVLNP